MTEFFNNKTKLTDKLRKNREYVSMLCSKYSTKIYRSHEHKKCYYLEQSLLRG
jgi:hypothetical protein